MIDTAETRERCRLVAARLQEEPHWPVLRTLHLELTVVAGQLQGTVAQCRRTRGQTEEVRQAERALDQLKAGIRQVGLNIRLASESALAIGLETSLQSAFETLDWLQRMSPEL